MTQQEFLLQLEQKLSILKPTEITDILEEYRLHIENKIREGKTEKEVIADFGPIDYLVCEILDAYHINVQPSNRTEDTSSNNFKYTTSDEKQNDMTAAKNEEYLNNLKAGIKSLFSKSFVALMLLCIETCAYIILFFLAFVPFYIAESFLLLPFYFLPYQYSEFAIVLTSILMHVLFFGIAIIIYLDFLYQNIQRKPYISLFMHISALVQNRTVLFRNMSTPPFVGETDAALRQLHRMVCVFAVTLIRVIIFLLLCFTALGVVVGSCFTLGMFYLSFIGLPVFSLSIVIIGFVLLGIVIFLVLKKVSRMIKSSKYGSIRKLFTADYTNPETSTKTDPSNESASIDETQEV